MTHGDAGPGTTWVSRATVGAVAGFQTGTAAYRTRGAAGTHVIAAEETAIPAISRILEVLPPAVEAHVVVEVPATAGEQKSVAAVRRHLTGTLGAEKRSVYFCPYWIQGMPRG